jgi:hypothetical protein
MIPQVRLGEKQPIDGRPPVDQRLITDASATKKIATTVAMKVCIALLVTATASTLLLIPFFFLLPAAMVPLLILLSLLLIGAGIACGADRIISNQAKKKEKIADGSAPFEGAVAPDLAPKIEADASSLDSILRYIGAQSNPIASSVTNPSDIWTCIGGRGIPVISRFIDNAMKPEAKNFQKILPAEWIAEIFLKFWVHLRAIKWRDSKFNTECDQLLSILFVQHQALMLATNMFNDSKVPVATKKLSRYGIDALNRIKDFDSGSLDNLLDGSPHREEIIDEVKKLQKEIETFLRLQVGFSSEITSA